MAVLVPFTEDAVAGFLSAKLLLTVTVQVAVLFPSAVVAVIVAVPVALAVIKPLLTEATFVSLLLQFTVLLVALLG